MSVLTQKAVVRHEGLILPEGCRWCGWTFNEHGQSYVRGKGFHSWEPPTQAQIRARIQARLKVFLEGGRS